MPWRTGLVVFVAVSGLGCCCCPWRAVEFFAEGVRASACLPLRLSRERQMW